MDDQISYLQFLSSERKAVNLKDLASSVFQRVFQIFLCFSPVSFRFFTVATETASRLHSKHLVSMCDAEAKCNCAMGHCAGCLPTSAAASGFADVFCLHSMIRALSIARGWIRPERFLISFVRSLARRETCQALSEGPCVFADVLRV